MCVRVFFSPVCACARFGCVRHFTQLGHFGHSRFFPVLVALPQTIHSFSGDFRAYKALIAAAYNGVAIAQKDVDVAGNEHLSEAFLAKNPLGKVPVLETEQGFICESNAIARYVGRLRRDTELYGVSFFESAQVDSWLDFASNELEVPVSSWLYPVLGYLPFNAAVHTEAVAQVCFVRHLSDGDRHAFAVPFIFTACVPVCEELGRDRPVSPLCVCVWLSGSPCARIARCALGVPNIRRGTQGHAGGHRPVLGAVLPVQVPV
jgi:hypothetical protein